MNARSRGWVAPRSGGYSARTPAPAPITNLDDRNTGRYTVQTKHSRYLIDLDAGTWERTPDSMLAGKLKRGNSGNLWRLYCKVGEPLWIVDVYDKPNGGARQVHSTAVESITVAKPVAA